MQPYKIIISISSPLLPFYPAGINASATYTQQPVVTITLHSNYTIKFPVESSLAIFENRIDSAKECAPAQQHRQDLPAGKAGGKTNKELKEVLISFKNQPYGRASCN